MLSQKFRFLQIEEESSVLNSFLTLINYKGKLGALVLMMVTFISYGFY